MRRRTRRGALVAALFATVGVLSAVHLPASPAATTPAPAITVTPATATGVVKSLLFGANDRYSLDASGGADPTTGITYPGFQSQLTNAGVSLLRFPGGTVANAYQWSKAVGAQNGRGQQVSGSISNPATLDSTYGPDEYGARLDATHISGDLMLNFATSNAAEQADFVQYMTGTVSSTDPSSTPYAKMRSDNGHSAPYPVSFAEVSNEPYYTNETYWMRGTLVSVGHGQSGCATASSTFPTITACLYAYGGSTAFTAQPLVKPTDWSPTAGISTGAANQSFAIQYAPVVTSTVNVYVGGWKWNQTSSLSTAGATSEVYTVGTDGTVKFGDGVHGKIPPTGKKLTVDYTSGPHDGFVDYYTKIKAVAPNLPVCASMDTPEFLQVMGTANKYDCVVAHPYAQKTPPNTTTPTCEVTGPGTGSTPSTTDDDFLGIKINQVSGLESDVSQLRSTIDSDAGTNGPNIGILLSEWGDFGCAGTYDGAGLSLGEALFNANALADWISDASTANIIGAERHALIDYTFSPPPQDLGVSSMTNVLFAGPGPNPVAEPSLSVLQLFGTLRGQSVVASSVANNPTRTLSDGSSLASLHVFAVKGSAGVVHIAVINNDPDKAVTSTVRPGISHTATADVKVLNSTTYEDFNTPSHPGTVAVTDNPSAAIGSASGSFTWTFPAHSVTLINVTPSA